MRSCRLAYCIYALMNENLRWRLPKNLNRTFHNPLSLSDEHRYVIEQSMLLISINRDEEQVRH